MLYEDKLYEDKYGILMMSDEVEELFAWEVINRGIYASEMDV